jgi:tRNA dimethylallyltransferase
MKPNGHLVVVGATASGKSEVALEVARQRPGTELISMDSMALYRGMDIGTAAPTAAERADVPFHLLDLVEPTEEYSVSMFQEAARFAIDDMVLRSCRAVLVGGTGLHVRAVIDELEIPGQWGEVRAELDAEPETRLLYERLAELDPVAAGRMEPTNRRRVVRALEVSIGSGRPFSSFGPGLENYPPSPFTQIGLRVDRSVLDRRIADRYWRQLDEGFLDEVRRLADLPRGLSRSAAQALGYRELLAHLRGDCTLDQAVADAVAATCQFARRQERWFRRDPRIEWFEVADDPLVVVGDVLDRFDATAPEDLG